MSDMTTRRPMSPWKYGVIGFVTSIVAIFFTSAAILAFSAGSTGSVSIPSIITVTSDRNGFVMQTGSGIVLVPLLVAACAFVLGVIRAKRSTQP